MMRVYPSKKLSYLLFPVLLFFTLLAGCMAPAVKYTAKTEATSIITSTAQTGATQNSPSPSLVSRLPEILDGQKYANNFTIRTFNIAQKESTGSVNAGDIMLLQSPDGANMLIDTGHKETVSQVVEYIKKIGVTKLDYVVATHMHGDHVGGFSEVMNAFPVEKVISSKYAAGKVGTPKNFMSILNQKGKQLEIVKEGDSFLFGKEIKVEVLNPGDSEIEITEEDYTNKHTVNENSIVLKMTYGNNTFLFPGDILFGTERRLMEKYGDSLNVDMVKAPHHGYSTSSCSPFLNALSPAIAVIPQCSPTKAEVYPNYKKAGSNVYITGLDGIVLTVSDGKDIKVITENDRGDTYNFFK